VQIRLRDYGVLDFDSTDARRQPPVDTTWQQVLDYLPLALNFKPFQDHMIEIERFTLPT